MNILKLESLQKAYKVKAIQDQINSGLCWKLEGSVGRFAMNMLESGVCMLPLVPRIDAYGNRVPSRKELKPGTTGSYKNCSNFWDKVWDGDYDTIEALEETFGADVEEEVA